MGRYSVYRCPKCGGDKTYKAPRLGVNSQGQQEMIDTAICKECGEVSTRHFIDDSEDYFPSFWKKYRINIIWYGLIALGLIYISYKNGQEPSFKPDFSD